MKKIIARAQHEGCSFPEIFVLQIERRNGRPCIKFPVNICSAGTSLEIRADGILCIEYIFDMAVNTAKGARETEVVSDEYPYASAKRDGRYSKDRSVAMEVAGGEIVFSLTITDAALEHEGPFKIADAQIARPSNLAAAARLGDIEISNVSACDTMVASQDHHSFHPASDDIVELSNRIWRQGLLSMHDARKTN